MGEDLKINVGVGGAAKAQTDLHGVAAAEHAVGAAAQGGAAGIAKTAVAKKAAGEAAEELRMKDRSLLREFAMISPECAIAAEALHGLMTKTTGVGIAFVGVSAALSIAMLAYSKFSEYQAAEKARAAAVIAGLQEQSAAYLKLAASAEKAAQAKRGGIGAGAGEGLMARMMGLAPGGVSPEQIGRAGQLAAVAGRGLSDAEMEGLMIQVALGKEPVKGTDRRKVTSMLGGQDLGALRAGMAGFAAASPRTARAATAESMLAREALTPAGEVAERLEIVDKFLKAHPERVPGEATTAAGRLLAKMRLAPGVGMERFEYRQQFAGGQSFEDYRPSQKGEQAIVIIERAVINQGGVHYAAPGADPAGVVPRSGMKN